MRSSKSVLRFLRTDRSSQRRPLRASVVTFGAVSRFIRQADALDRHTALGRVVHYRVAETRDHSPKLVSFLSLVSCLFNRFRLEPALLFTVSEEVDRSAWCQ
jgi:hypothetical protein